MVECDELGEFLVSHYGEQREQAITLAEKRAYLERKKKDRSAYVEGEARRILGAFDRMCRLKESNDDEG
jgi:hypothetical protein